MMGRSPLPVANTMLALWASKRLRCVGAGLHGMKINRKYTFSSETIERIDFSC